MKIFVVISNSYELKMSINQRYEHNFSYTDCDNVIKFCILILEIKSGILRSFSILSFLLLLNPLRPNSNLSQTSHCNNKGLSVREVMRIENMITQVKFY